MYWKRHHFKLLNCKCGAQVWYFWSPSICYEPSSQHCSNCNGIVIIKYLVIWYNNILYISQEFEDISNTSGDLLITRLIWFQEREALIKCSVCLWTACTLLHPHPLSLYCNGDLWHKTSKVMDLKRVWHTFNNGSGLITSNEIRPVFIKVVTIYKYGPWF